LFPNFNFFTLFGIVPIIKCLLKSLQKKPDCTWRELVTNMRDYLKTNGFEQIAQISSGKFEDIDQKVFL
jgi:hypothetical protein